MKSDYLSHNSNDTNGEIARIIISVVEDGLKINRQTLEVRLERYIEDVRGN